MQETRDLSEADAPVSDSSDQLLAPLADRFAAAAVDLALLGGLAIVGCVLAGQRLSQLVPNHWYLWSSPFFWTVAACVLAAGWTEEGWGGATVGKKRLHLRVVRFSGPCTPTAAFVRNLTKAIGILLLPFSVVPAVLVIALGPDRQRLGDLVAGTRVVRN